MNKLELQHLMIDSLNQAVKDKVLDTLKSEALKGKMWVDLTLDNDDCGKVSVFLKDNNFNVSQTDTGLSVSWG